MTGKTPNQSTDDPAGYRSRSYQTEMFEASLKGNIIVTMGTGSGKTHIALLRIKRELERNPHKLIWFLTPTVALCQQQYRAIAEHIPAMRARTLTGLDKVELWTDQAVWDAVLRDVQVVFSTHAVLADAMSHGFVRIGQLSLMIFDEAHHCMRRHPANKIMQDFYHPAVAVYGPDAVPKVLGLTASPIVRSNPQELQMIEANLDAICKTPRVHRHELRKFTHCPHLQPMFFAPFDYETERIGSRTLQALIKAWETLDIETDPSVKQLRKSLVGGQALQKALLSGKTHCREQLRKFVARSTHIFEELGEWAVDYYIAASYEQLRSKSEDSQSVSGWTDEERAYLINFLSQLPAPEPTVTSSDPNDYRTSRKFGLLLEFLHGRGHPDFAGLIFAKQRVTVSVLARLLSVYPLTRDRFRCAAYVGWSNGSSKDALGELLDPRLQRETLSEFKSGQKNLIVATDVLEEGIDISACSVVVCYDKPPNLKSFVQRRGRARHKESTYAIMFATDDESSGTGKWESLEQAMIKAYEDDERKLLEAWALEEVHEDVIERFVVESTGAVLTADGAVAHLTHFCDVLPAQPYVDTRAEYSFEIDDTGLLRGTVVLPACVHPKVRRTDGKRWWKTERAARKEAAFQAYKALYEFGLLNDNLLPFTGREEFKQDELSDIPALIEVSEQYDPWIDLAYSWSSPELHQTRIAVGCNGKPAHMYVRLTTPTVLPTLDPMTLYWDSKTTYTLGFGAFDKAVDLTAEAIEHLGSITSLFLQATISKHTAPEQDFVLLFGPDVPHTELESWFLQYGGFESASHVYARNNYPAVMGVVRDCYNNPLLFRRWIVSQEDDLAVIEVECDRLPRRTNLLHRQTLATKLEADLPVASTKVCVMPADSCTIEKLSFEHSIFGRFISAIMDRLEAKLLATRLCETVLCDVGFSSTHHVITAITSPSASALTNYQRYEFFGDTILKFTVSCQLFFEHPNWHEGYLSKGRDSIIKNHRLARAALDAGLDAFIISKTLTPRKWSAPLISEKLAYAAGRRSMSMKVLADVVEALIGAAYLDGGFDRAHACIRRFLPEINLNHFNQSLPYSTPSIQHIVNEKRLIEHIGYTFKDPSILIEALTHPSCQHDASTQSYQRLEFLGDSVLDMVILTTLLAHPTEISQGRMTQIKGAVVNANLLAFFCMEFSLSQERTHVDTHSAHQITLTSTQEFLSLWHFMRCGGGTDLKQARDRALARHRALRGPILDALQHSPDFPWQALSALNADKFFSDLVESILGAIFVDSAGELAVCVDFAERIGLLRFLRRVLNEEIEVVHPKMVAQQLAATAGLGNTIFTTTRLMSEAQEETVKEDATYRCQVEIDGEVIVTAEGCSCADEAQVKAAYLTIESLQRRGL
ncbi:putative RNA helicase/RNAse III [Aspergillus saccharolyticus JOP 1030-1]|uniref:Dicer-like protein 2-1 n=1 Tax=Aspergillus saccharolyticus JOP 1030-1 TaxID=1450539 RepID=A0A318ZRW8_9EURO|nr:dicer-like protein 2-1 [Aspergillus saccharolyticus JOP 1030-1]PYH49827.1 dicer-like protein 2-1 [Aspergillus saccharolyticus JOP 1030-1]